MDNINRMKELICQLNIWRDEYYNKARPSVSDKEYDKYFDELIILEKETGIYMSNSPTQSVGYEVKSELNKVKHNHPMLSLDKTKQVLDIVDFFKEHDGIAMLKMDGLTCSLNYQSELIAAETRGNGEVGEDILHNAKVLSNIPLKVKSDNLIVDGEVIIDYPTFEKINESLTNEDKYKNPRNLASGSIRQLNSKIAAERGVRFIAWKLVQGVENNDFCERLQILENMGFEIVPFFKVTRNSSEEDIQNIINALIKIAEKKQYPIDGIVFGYSDVNYGESLGKTTHHVRSQIAFKFKDDEYETILKEIEWTMGKTGSLTPVAVFEPVEIDGTEIERASVHNISILTHLDLMPGDTITVYKANMIIPQIAQNLSLKERKFHINGLTDVPKICPICGGKTNIKQENDTKILICTNENCQGKLLGRLSHFVSKNAMNIEGMSEATLNFMIEKGWIKSFKDIYSIPFQKDIYEEWIKAPGFGKRSVDKLKTAIEKSKITTLERFLYAQSIPLIGHSVSKDISKYCKGSLDTFCNIMVKNKAKDFLEIEGFGEAMYESVLNWFDNHWIEFVELQSEFVFQKENQQNSTEILKGKTICITGSLIQFNNREELISSIEANGGKVVGSVSKNCDYLLTNDKSSGSSKNKKALELNIPIISEEDYLKMIK